MDLNFSKKYRLSGQCDIQAAFDDGKKLKFQYFLVFYRPNELPHARIAVLLKKHYAKQAVTRNWIRRVIRQSFRHHKNHLKGLDILLVLCTKYTPENKNKIPDTVEHLWQLIKKPLKKR